MCGLALLAALSWLLALKYYSWYRSVPANQKVENSFGLGSVIIFLVQFMVMIFIFKMITGVTKPAFSAPNYNPSTGMPVDKGLSIFQWGLIILLAIFLYLMMTKEVLMTLMHNFPKVGLVIYFFFCILLSNLIALKIGNLGGALVSNLLLFTVVIIIAGFAHSLKKSAFLLLFVMIAIFDICLVWIVSGPGSSGSGGVEGFRKNWYVAMFQSEFFQHFPFPIGFRWGSHLIGNGDILFIGLTVVYLRRVWNKTAAMVAGALVTLPIMLLPLAVYILQRPPLAWPYTIFIAPVAIVMALLAPKKLSPKVEDNSEIAGT